ncbi:hypothetical protein CP980_15540 [Streptomyces vinaceus]|uniref:Uncharacterized protein n=1 Tax=Streptomyces vinaceus TaxID=1960 RepID=A0A5J6JC74_STRVI|nr:hypothetical protein [Streptomyces vinaceus]QEV46324.1 hypothetical protein CP980_15540 [Streptomyces vinaceus]GHE65780.1 hypothetical protein GCM10017778_58320 [Streptomyces vinaceus]
MSPETTPEDPALEATLRRAGIVAFLAGAAATFAFFAFFPGLPHVIDWGAIIAALAIGTLSRWACRTHLRKHHAHPD